MSNGSWESIYVNQGRVQVDVLDSVVEASKQFSDKGYKRVLDLGCGTGRHTYFLADKGFDVHACDISEAGVNITKKLIGDADLTNVDYSIQNMYDLTFKDGSFEAVLCIWVQGHGYREEIISGINELHRILKQGGTVVTDFVTVDDETYGLGEEIAADTFVGGREGEEGIVHYYTSKDELCEFFAAFEEVKLTDKVYTFTDDSSKAYRIVAVVVEARK